MSKRRRWKDYIPVLGPPDSMDKLVWVDKDVTVIEGHEPVYTLADVEAAYRAASNSILPENEGWLVYRKTLKDA